MKTALLSRAVLCPLATASVLAWGGLIGCSSNEPPAGGSGGSPTAGSSAAAGTAPETGGSGAAGASPGVGAAGGTPLGGAGGASGSGGEPPLGGGAPAAAGSAGTSAGSGGDVAAGGGAGGAAGSGAGGTAGGGGTGGAAGGGPGGAGGQPSRSGPPMGWASWNTFAAKIDFNVIKAQADALASSGMKAAGYEYVNIDEGWWQGTRNAAGDITVDNAEWPGGMAAIADYIHGLGLKAGIYTDAGKDGCGFYFPTGRPAAPGSGSEGHYEQDFLAFSRWGFDFVKVDWCGGDKEKLDPRTAYQAIGSAIAKATLATGRPLALSVCNWGIQSPWTWAPSISTMWRTSYDIIYYGEMADMTRVLANWDTALHPSAQTPGHYNDPDMLIVGMSGFNLAQNRTHFALWAMSGSPLLAGNNLATMSADTKSVLTNAEVIAINQDPLAKQGARISDAQGKQVYGKELSGERRRAVLLLNRSETAGNIAVRFADLGLGANAAVRDVWKAQDLGPQTTSYSANVPARDSVLLLVTGQN